ncbi:MAG: helix-turn-helix transcriptional regulator [bacterium]|nr:helix-turn-helix transcriptional regulator [bacterium]
MEETLSIIRLVGIIQSVFLFLALLFRKTNRLANRFLSITLAFFSIDLLEQYLAAKGYYAAFTEYRLCIIPYAYLFGPCVFLYTAFLISKIKKITMKLSLFFVPFGLGLVLNIFSNYMYIIPARIAGTSIPATGIYIHLAVNGLGLISESVFYILSFYLLQQYTRQLKEYFSDIDRLRVLWLRGLIIAFFLGGLAANIIYLQGAFDNYKPGLLDSITLLGGSAIVFIIAFFAIIQPEIFNRVKIMSERLPEDDSSESPKYEKLRLPADREKEYVKKLVEHMSAEKPYLEDDLTLQDLADDLSITTHHLSMILNIHVKQSFYNFVNEYRVEEVKTKLADPENQSESILSIAYSVGFNSKSTFNTMFKKFTGKTPKEFRIDAA